MCSSDGSRGFQFAIERSVQNKSLTGLVRSISEVQLTICVVPGSANNKGSLCGLRDVPNMVAIWRNYFSYEVDLTPLNTKLNRQDNAYGCNCSIYEQILRNQWALCRFPMNSSQYFPLLSISFAIAVPMIMCYATFKSLRRSCQDKQPVQRKIVLCVPAIDTSK